MSGQLALMELSVRLTLAAIESASMQLPDNDILERFYCCCAFAFHCGIRYRLIKSRFKHLIHGRAAMLAAIIYMLLVFAMCMMGKRMSGPLRRNELVAIVAGRGGGYAAYFPEKRHYFGGSDCLGSDFC
jgi:uncharacterized membrane protein YcaP (DUF421 family)